MKRVAVLFVIALVSACAEREKQPEQVPVAQNNAPVEAGTPALKYLGLPVKKPLLGANKLDPSASASGSAAPSPSQK